MAAGARPRLVGHDRVELVARDAAPELERVGVKVLAAGGDGEPRAAARCALQAAHVDGGVGAGEERVLAGRLLSAAPSAAGEDWKMDAAGSPCRRLGARPGRGRRGPGFGIRDSRFEGARRGSRKMFMFGVQNVSPDRPALENALASVAMAPPTAAHSVSLKEEEVPITWRQAGTSGCERGRRERQRQARARGARRRGVEAREGGRPRACGKEVAAGVGKAKVTPGEIATPCSASFHLEGRAGGRPAGRGRAGIGAGREAACGRGGARGCAPLVCRDGEPRHAQRAVGEQPQLLHRAQAPQQVCAPARRVGAAGRAVTARGSAAWAGFAPLMRSRVGRKNQQYGRKR